MTVPLRAVQPGQPRRSHAVLRSCFFLFLCTLFGASAFAQGLTPGGPVDFGSVSVGNTTTQTLKFSAPPAGVDIQSVSAVTEGAPNLDFKVVSNTCTGILHLPATCNIELSFTPTQIGVRLGALVIVDTANVVVNTVYLAGDGLGPQFVFAPTTAVTTSSASITPASFTAGAGVLDGTGNLFFTDVAHNRILERTPAGVYSVVPTAGLLTISATSGITIDGDGNLYVSSGALVYSFMPGNTPVPLPTPGVTLVSPAGLAIDRAGDLYIADSSNNAIYQVPLGDNAAAALAITGPGASLSGPTGLGIDASSNLYIADTGNSRIVEVNLGSLTSSVVALNSLTLTNPTGVSVDAAGTIYIANTGGSDIIESTATGTQFVLTDPALTLDTPSNVVIEANGDLVISDYTLGLIDLHRSMPAIVFPTATLVGSFDITDDPLSLTVQSSGNVIADLTVSAGGDPSISTSAFPLGNTGTCPVLASGGTVSAADAFQIGQICTYAIDFKPTVIGPNLANLILTTSGSGQTTSNTVPLSGNGLPSISYFTLVASPNVTTIGTPVSLTLTAERVDGTTATDYVGTVTFTDTDSTSKYLGGTGAGTGTTTYTFTAADDGVLVIPAGTGLQFNQLGTFTAFATDNTHSATSNPVRVVEPSTLTLTSSVNPSQVNQQTTFTLNVGSPGPAPGGTVTFYSNGVAIGTSNVTAGAASLVYSFSAVGTYAITAIYSGDVNTNAGSAGPLSQVVVNSTVLTLASSVNPSLVGQSTNLTATIVALGTPTGTVKFYDGATLIGTVNVSGNTAVLPVSFSTAGTHVLTAVYSGDIHTEGATSAPLNQIVLNVAAITLTSSVNPSLINQTTTLTAHLTALGTPTGTVKFYDGATLIGTANLTANTASVNVSFSTPGTHVLTAVYSGDTLTETITSAPLDQIVLNLATITLTSSVNPSLVNQSMTLTANLSSLGAVTGTVKFFDGANQIDIANVAGGVASVSVSFAAAGTHILTAVYSGDSTVETITSAPLNQIVLNVATITLTSSINPSLLNQSTTLTADLTALGSPTGTVKFYDGATLIGTSNVAGGIATVSVSFSTSGTHVLTAVYSGDTLTETITSAPLNQVVLNATTVTLTTSVNPVFVNANTTLTASVHSSGTPTGTVTFYAGTTKLGTATITGGVATLVVSFPTAGIYSLTAVYSGDGNNQPATSAPVSQTVLNLVTVTLTSSVNPVFLNNPTILTALLTSTGVAPTGTVSFFDGSTPLGTVAVINSSASISASFVYAGTHTITAMYSGDPLSGAASAPAYSQIVADFSFAVASGGISSGSAIAGGTANYSLTLSPLITTTLPSGITFTVTGLPTGATSVLAPTSIAAGAGVTPVAFSVTAAQIVAALDRQSTPPHRSPAHYAPVALAFLALPLAWSRRRKRFGSLLASICLLLAIGGLTGCVSDPTTGYYGQTPKTYNLTVTATSGNLARSVYLTLTIQ